MGAFKQRRAHELRALLSLPLPTLASVVPADASCESLQVSVALWNTPRT